MTKVLKDEGMRRWERTGITGKSLKADVETRMNDTWIKDTVY